MACEAEKLQAELLYLLYRANAHDLTGAWVDLFVAEDVFQIACDVPFDEESSRWHMRLPVLVEQVRTGELDEHCEHALLEYIAAGVEVNELYDFYQAVEAEWQDAVERHHHCLHEQKAGNPVD